MAFIPVRQEQPVFQKKKDTEGKILGGLQAIGGTMAGIGGAMGAAATAAGTAPSPWSPYLLAGGAILSGASALRGATRPEPSPGSYSNVPQNVNLVQPTTMQSRLDSLTQNPVEQIQRAKTALDYLDLDQQQRMYYEKPLNEALARYQSQSNRRGGYA